MKSVHSHLAALRNLQYNPRIPRSPRIVIFGSPNVGTHQFAQRLAIDIGVPALSMRNIYKNLLVNSEQYKGELFYRQVIDLLREGTQQEIQSEFENNLIPEKLLTLTKFTEHGFVLTDYPQTTKQAEKYILINPV
jgi:adenylate kinase family enzyme